MRETMKTYYHFTGDKLRDGRPIPAVGEWLNHEGQIEMCVSGLHASAHPFDALKYAPGNLLHKVILKDIVEKQDDKVVARSRKIVATIDATELLRRFARQQALSVVHLWDAPPVVKEYLETGNEELRAAAWNAAGDAVRAAAWDAAGDAAWAAVRAAARDAAWAAAWDAAWAAAWVVWDAAREQFSTAVDEAFAKVGA